MKRLNLGIIGAGPIVEKKHLPACTEVPEIAVTALCRRNPQELERIADRFGIGRRYNDYRQLLEQKDIDAVLVATGPDSQPAIVKEAAAARKHVFIEKPMAETSAGAVEMAQAVKSSGIEFQVGFNKRYYYGYRQAKKLALQGELGNLSGIHARFWYQVGRRDGLLHNGIHFCDLASFFMGPATEVLARSLPLTAQSQGLAPETLSVSLRFESGAVGNLLLSSAASWDYPNEHLDLVGSNHNALSVDNCRQLRLFRRGEDEPIRLYDNTLSVHWWSGNEEQGFTLQLRAFARRILGGEAQAGSDSLLSLSAGAEDGIRSLRLIEAIKKSLSHNANVAVAA